MKTMSRSANALLLCLSLLIAASLACNFLARQIMPATLDDADDLADINDLSAALAAEIVDDRPEVMAYLGRPDAFDISIIQVDEGVVRMESWRYYQFGTRVDFVDGEAVWTIEIEPMPEGTIFAAWYDPLAFETGMTGAEASQVVSAASPAGAAPQLIDLAEGGDDLTGGSTLIGDQIIIGLYKDRVIYVETIALTPEGEDLP